MKNILKAFPLIILLISATPVLANETKCSIHAKQADDKSLSKLAKITMKDAKKIANAKIASDQKLDDGELEAEDNCLIYSFDIKTKNKSGEDELWIDAGNGKIIKSEHENANEEKAEETEDK